MYTPDSLFDMNRRTHVSFAKIIDHCRQLSHEQLITAIDGFGYPSVQLQLHHTIAAQKYWLGVIEGRMDVDDDPATDVTIDDLSGYRSQVAASVDAYLQSASSEELVSERLMITWGGRERALTPVHLIVRPLMHYFHHQGQVAAMCRILGMPVPPGMDYPLGAEPIS